MKKLSKGALAERTQITARLMDAHKELEDAIEQYNDAVEQAYEKVEAAAEKLNDEIEEAKSFCENIAGEIDEYMGDRSEKWLESENGQMFQMFKDAYEQAELKPADLEKPEQLSAPDFDPEVLVNLPESYDEV